MQIRCFEFTITQLEIVIAASIFSGVGIGGFALMINNLDVILDSLNIISDGIKLFITTLIPLSLVVILGSRLFYHSELIRNLISHVRK